MPGLSVVSPIAGESKEELERAMKWVEEEIEKMIEEGIPSENIVLSGASQGGSLTLYTALHTKYKIGGFIPLVAWQPLLKIEPPASLPTPINKDTPIFHMNGKLDPIVPLICGWKTSAAFKQVFSNYNLETVVGTHLTSINPFTIPKIYCFLKKKVPGMALSRLSALTL
jgi:predicted esterase